MVLNDNHMWPAGPGREVRPWRIDNTLVEVRHLEKAFPGRGMCCSARGWTTSAFPSAEDRLWVCWLLESGCVGRARWAPKGDSACKKPTWELMFEERTSLSARTGRKIEARRGCRLCSRTYSSQLKEQTINIEVNIDCL